MLPTIQIHPPFILGKLSIASQLNDSYFNYLCFILYQFIVSSMVGMPTPFFLRKPPPLSEANLKSFHPPFILSRIYYVFLRTILSQLRISLSLLFILSGSTLYLLLTLALVRYYL